MSVAAPPRPSTRSQRKSQRATTKRNVWRTPAQIKTLELAALKVASGPDEYQREQYDRWVKKLSTVFKVDIAQMILVSERDGEHWIMDGQHICAVLMGEGFTHAECLVYVGKTERDEAEFFSQINKYQKKPTKPEEFKAALKSEDAFYVKLNEILTEAGFRVGNTNNGRTISAVGALMAVAPTIKLPDGEPDWATVREGIEGLRLWQQSRKSPPASLVGGMLMFYRDVSPETPPNPALMKQVFGSLSIDEMKLHLSEMKFGPHGANSQARNDIMRDVIFTLYNGRRRTRRLKWRSGAKSRVS